MAVQLKLAFDPGSSLTKSFYQIGGNPPSAFLMDPEVIEVPTGSIYRQNATGVITPSNDAWIKFGQRSSTCFAVGFLAQQLSASVQLREVKYRSAVVKLLALIGAICESEGVITERINLSVALTLPWSEYSDRDSLEKALRARANKFYFRDSVVQCHLDRVAIVVEGGGFAFQLLDVKGESWFTSRDEICCLMLGHRNSSLLTFQKGKVNSQKSETTDLGFVQLVDKVRARNSGHSREELSASLYKIDSNISPDNSIIQYLARRRNRDATSSDFKALAKIIDDAREEYWQLIKDWMQNLIERPDALCIGGGAGYYLRKSLHEHFGEIDLVWGKPASEIKRIALELEDPSLNRRLIDVWYVFEHYYVNHNEASHRGDLGGNAA